MDVSGSGLRWYPSPGVVIEYGKQPRTEVTSPRERGGSVLSVYIVFEEDSGLFGSCEPLVARLAR